MYTSRRGDEQHSCELEDNHIKFHPLATDEFNESPNFMKLKELVWGKDILIQLKKH